MSFWGELKRRKVVQVSAVYAVVAWLLVQIVATIKQPLSLPPWFDTVVIILLAVGFPIAVILAWAFDLGPGGITPTAPETREPRLGPAPSAFSNVVQILILAAVGFLLLDQYFFSNENRSADAVPPSADRALNYFALTIVDNHPDSNSRWPVFDFAATGRRFIYNTDSAIFVRDLGMPEPRPIAGSGNRFSNPFLSPDGRFVAYWSTRGALVKLAIEDGTPEVVVPRVGDIYGGSWSFDDSILFVDNIFGIARVPGNGGEVESLVPVSPGIMQGSPRLLPDGDTVLYSRKAVGSNWDDGEIVAYSISSGEETVVHRGGSDARYVEPGYLVYVIGDRLFGIAFDLETLKTIGSPRELIAGVTRGEANSGADFGIARDGTLAFLHRRAEQRRRLVWFDRNGGSEDLAVAPGNYWYVQLCPEDALIAVNGWEERNRRVWIVDARSGDMYRLSALDESEASTGLCSSAGQVAYAAGFGSGEAGIVLRPADRARGEESLLRYPEEIGYLVPTAFSPGDDRLLALTPRPPRVTWALSLSDNAAAVPLLEGDGYSLYNATVSPDGRWLAYQSDRTGALELYVRPYPSADPDLERQVSMNGGQNPAWSRDEKGSELFFLEPADAPGQYNLMAVAVDPGAQEVFTHGTPQRLFTTRFFTSFATFRNPYDVSADGSRFLVIQDAPLEDAKSGTSEFVIVQNFVEELKRLVPISVE